MSTMEIYVMTEEIQEKNKEELGKNYIPQNMTYLYTSVRSYI